MLKMDCSIKRESPHLDKCLKRSNKPLMERRRRERINSSLNQLKYLVLEALNKDTSQYSKLEKADILEMAVQHLQHTHNANKEANQANESTVIQKYTAGFRECATEVSNYLSNVSCLNADIQSKLISHLTQCSRKISSSQLPREHIKSYHPSPEDIHSPSIHKQSHISPPVQYVNVTSQDTMQNCTSERLNASPCANVSPQMSLINGSIYVIPSNNCQLSSYINILPQNNISVNVPCSNNAALPIMMSPKLEYLLTPPPSPTDEKLLSKHYVYNSNYIISPDVPSKIEFSGCVDKQLWRPW